MKKSQKSRKSQKKMRKNEQDWKRKDRTRFWMKRLEDDLGLMTIPAVEAPSYEGDEEESSSGCDKEQDQDSDTSHEQGIEEVIDDSSEEANKDDLMKERHGS
jgi:hypothetical protein